MRNKLMFLWIINIGFLFSPAFAQEKSNNYESTVPPIQYPEKNNDEMQVRKDIKSSFYKYDDTNSPISESQPAKKINNTPTTTSRNFLDEKPKEKSFEDILEKNETPKKIENKKNERLNFSSQTNTSRPSELWKLFLLSVIFIGILASLGYLLTRLRNKGLFAISKTDKVMDIISTLPISPKRQIMILKIRDQEIVVSNTENGINFLTEVSGGLVNRSLQEKRQLPISDKFLLPKQEKNLYDKIEQKNEINNTQNDKNTERKSDILLKALKSINSNNLNQRKNKPAEENSNSSNKTETFPKYLANQFENESKKEVKKRDEEVDSVENVTNLIREKLRSMKPLN
ncbi:flagellar biosynthetic protein FliO [Silvanigrella aquatica]|uniref:Flagellar protein n=1 Tax=Silvanigrella aquatica TaxID=1915309 RepID=A0A1L4CXP5_9BACT|nr:flagellar biosynthetic protein FliO [Silvanigrella aquatica]APJ02717.1 hypothetical protein AXG55_01745 [Silvanigrella aquatica]